MSHNPQSQRAYVGYATDPGTHITKHVVQGTELESLSTLDFMKDTRYNESSFLKLANEFIKGTYARHYVGATSEDQVLDFWQSLGSVATTCRDTAIKYLARYGKKDGYNANDLYKAIHYIALMDYFTKELQSAEKAPREKTLPDKQAEVRK